MGRPHLSAVQRARVLLTIWQAIIEDDRGESKWSEAHVELGEGGEAAALRWCRERVPSVHSGVSSDLAAD